MRKEDITWMANFGNKKDTNQKFNINIEILVHHGLKS